MFPHIVITDIVITDIVITDIVITDYQYIVITDIFITVCRSPHGDETSAVFPSALRSSLGKSSAFQLRKSNSLLVRASNPRGPRVPFFAATYSSSIPSLGHCSLPSLGAAGPLLRSHLIIFNPFPRSLLPSLSGGGGAPTSQSRIQPSLVRSSAKGGRSTSLI